MIGLCSQVVAAPTEKVVLQLKWIHAFQFAGYYAAQQQGYYRDAGLIVDIRAAQPETNVISSVTSNSAHYGVGTSSLLLAHHDSRPVVVLAAIFQHSPQIIITRQQRLTDGIHNLVGKNIMLEGQSDELTAYLRQEGISTTQFNIVEHTFNPHDIAKRDIYAMSAYATNEPYFLKKKNIAFNAYTPRSIGIDFYGDNLFTSKQEMQENPKRVEAFRQASLRGWEYAMTHFHQ